MRYFLTGATGFVGGQVARQLLSAGHEVVALVRSPERAADLASAGARLVAGDMTDRRAVRSAMEGADGVFHVGGWYRVGVRDTAAAWRDNVEATRCVLETMRELGIPKGVYTSTLGQNSDTHGRLVDERYVYRGRHLSVYYETKWVAHHEVAVPLARAGVPLVVVMPGVIYGLGDHSLFHDSLVAYLRRRLPVLPLGTTYCWSHLEDTARGHILAMERGVPGETYIISGPPVRVTDVFDLAERVTGIPAPRIRLYPGILKATAHLVDLFDDFLPLPPTYTAEGLRVNAGPTYIASDAKARRELGFTTRPLEEGLRETIVTELTALGLPSPVTAD